MNPHTPFGVLLGAILAWSLTFLLTASSILERPRAWVQARSLFFTRMFRCPYCTGFHVGWFLAVLGVWLTPHGLTPFTLYLTEHLSAAPRLLGVLADGVFFAATTYWLELLVQRLEPPT